MDHENTDWFHPSFESLRDASIALINRSTSSGTFLVTDIPETEKSYGLYRDGDFVLLLRGENWNDITQSSIHRKLSTGGYAIFGIDTDRVFMSLYDLVEYYRRNPPPELQTELVEPLLSCASCRKCRHSTESTDTDG